MIDFLKKIYSPDIDPQNYIKIYKNNILHNFNVLQKHQNTSEIFPVIKSNAYGHGIKEVSKILKETNAKYICVDSFPEYQVAKKYSGKKVLVLGETKNNNYKYFDFKKSTFCVYNTETLDYLLSLNKSVTIHIFINTGMNREGFQENEIDDVCKKLQNSKIIVEGVCSHFSSADDISLEIYNKQVEQFKYLYKIIKKYNINPFYKHISASSGTLKMEDDFFNAFRPGMSLFGINTLQNTDTYFTKGNELKPCMEIFSTVNSTQNVSEGEGISYNLTYKTDKNTKIALIPFGYYEGLNRKVSSNYFIQIKNKYYPIRGRICMNYCIAEIGNDNIHVGDEVCIISKDKFDKNTFYALAEKSGTIPYESCVMINQNIKRIVV